MLLLSKSLAREMAEAILDACDNLDLNTETDIVTIDRVKHSLVCMPDAELTTDSVIAVTQDLVISQRKTLTSNLKLVD